MSEERLLTGEQIEILGLMAEGLTTPVIAERLGADVGIVHGIINQILVDLNARSRLEAVLKAYRLGLVGDSASPNGE
jgi:DNA-binding NarL/FixJ family response regulator